MASFNAYISTVESRIGQRHQSESFLGPVDQGRLRNGELVIDRLAPASPSGFPGAMLHHWRGAAFAPGAKAADFEHLMRNFNGYPQYFSPQVVRARILSQDGDSYQVVMRVKQHHVITVVMDTSYDVNFAHPIALHTEAPRGYSISRSTRISEIESAGTSQERALAPGDDHGFLWRLNTYWSYEERDGGLYMQIESVSLTRAIPTGLGWVIGPFVESVPRESLEFTLRSTCDALKKIDAERATRMNATLASTNDGSGFQFVQRINRSLTAAIEKRALVWMAEHAPAWLTSDQLTVLGLSAQIAAGVCYALSRYNRYALLLVIVFIALNWLGDSLDGTLARVRQQQRPRFGFYVDHVVDVFGSIALMTGLACSGFLHWQTAMAMLIGFLLLSSESYLATYTLSCFQMSQGFFGPTEIRILLIIGNLALLRSPYSTLLGHKLLLFDVGGVIAAAGMFVMAVVITVRHTAALYREEPLR